jgi:methylmalonyl-CoA/ethylmalonyl-CoA epimerase
MSDALNVTGLAQVAFSVKDLERAVAFYRDVMGLTFLFSAPPQMAFLQCGPTRLMLSAQPDGEAESHPILYYLVPDIQAAFAALAENGAPIKQPPHIIARLGANDLWLGFTEDPDGHHVGVMSEVPAASA